jgi:hypothetical protein
MPLAPLMAAKRLHEGHLFCSEQAERTAGMLSDADLTAVPPRPSQRPRLPQRIEEGKERLNHRIDDTDARPSERIDQAFTEQTNTPTKQLGWATRLPGAVPVAHELYSDPLISAPRAPHILLRAPASAAGLRPT